MSIDLQKMVWDDPEAKGTAKLVLLCLASFVPQQAWTGGRDLLAWPSQNTIARRCGVERSTVERALKKLTEHGKIRDTGLRKTRRSVVYQLYPSSAPDVMAGYEMADLPDDAASHLPDPAASGVDMPGSAASGGSGADHLPDPAHHLPDPAHHLPDPAASTCPISPHKRVRREENSREIGEMNAGARARVVDSDPGELAEELAEVEELLRERPADRLLSGRRDELRRQLGGDRLAAAGGGAT